jgi:hypothetical protein
VLLSYGEWRKYVTIFSSQHLSNDQLLDLYRNWYCLNISDCDPESITEYYHTVEGKITKEGIFNITLKLFENVDHYKRGGELSRPVEKREMNVFPSFMVHKNGTLEPWDQKQAADAVMSIQNYPLELPKDIRRKIAEMILSSRPTFHTMDKPERGPDALRSTSWVHIHRR